MAKIQKISKQRAELIAKAHACARCKEYSYKRITVREATAAITTETSAIWVATKTCGVCAYQEEVGIAADGDIVYEG